MWKMKDKHLPFKKNAYARDAVKRIETHGVRDVQGVGAIGFHG